MRALVDSLRAILAVSSALVTIDLDVGEVGLLAVATRSASSHACRLTRLLTLELVGSLTLMPRLRSVHAIRRICVLEALHFSLI